MKQMGSRREMRNTISTSDAGTKIYASPFAIRFILQFTQRHRDRVIETETDRQKR